MPFLSPTQTLSAVKELRLFPTDFGCVLPRWQHELVVYLRWTTAKAPEVGLLTPAVKLLSTCLWQASFWHSCHFLVLFEVLEKTPRWVNEPHASTHMLQVVLDYMVTRSKTDLEKKTNLVPTTRPIWTWLIRSGVWKYHTVYTWSYFISGKLFEISIYLYWHKYMYKHN